MNWRDIGDHCAPGSPDPILTRTHAATTPSGIDGLQLHGPWWTLEIHADEYRHPYLLSIPADNDPLPWLSELADPAVDLLVWLWRHQDDIPYSLGRALDALADSMIVPRYPRRVGQGSPS